MIVFNELIDKLDVCSGILAVRCMLKFTENDRIKQVITEVKNTNYDHHLIFSQIGEKLGFINEEVIRQAFITTWCDMYTEKVNAFLERIRRFLPRMR